MSFIFPYPGKVDKSKYSKETSQLEALYGLPKEVQFCSKCVISNQRPKTSIEHQNDGKQIKKAISFSSSGTSITL